MSDTSGAALAAMGPHHSTVGDASIHDADRRTQLAHLHHVIEHAQHYLPAQGPINVFIHHNTLHAFEDLSFDDGVKTGARLFGCQPYLSEDRYRRELARGRILVADLEAALADDLGERADELLGFMGTRFHLRLAMLEHPLRIAPRAELRWFVAETDALAKFREDAPQAVRARLIETTRHWILRDALSARALAAQTPAQGNEDQSPLRGIPRALVELIEHFGAGSIENWSDRQWEAFTLQALWRACRGGVHGVRAHTPVHSAPLRHRDAVLEVTGEDCDLLVHEMLIRFCAAFLDQGVSHWSLPYRDRGFYRSFADIYRQPLSSPEAWRSELAAELNRLDQAGIEPLESVRESLELLGVAEADWEEFLTATLLALRGWAGMIHQLEARGDRVANPAPLGSLVEFLAVRLILDRLALQYVARQTLGFEGPLHELLTTVRAQQHKHEPMSVEQRAFLVFQLAQVLGWLPADLFNLSKPEWAALVGEIESFSAIDRRQLFHAAFERRYRTQTLDALTINNRRGERELQPPKFQVVCCLDEREESFRRHLEELEPRIETFGAAGFFNTPIYYRGAADAHFVPLCPIVIRPQHWVAEDVGYTLDGQHRRRAKTRRALGLASHQFHVGSRSFFGGALLAAGLGALATAPLVARVLMPRTAARIRRMFSNLVQPPPITQLELERHTATPGPEEGHLGFSLSEMVDIGERILRDIGLTSGFSRLFVVLGHGSNSLNNPHNSAYNCGACGGNAGGPNARSVARILNDPRVRERLAQRGLHVPETTMFLGGCHNTCNDTVEFFDLANLPRSHHADYQEFKVILQKACERNAHERCRRFQSAPLTMSFPAARRHVEARSEDLAQTRPECGHATNALCIIGRRKRTRGLYLDRRAFLTSYDPTQDDAESAILTRLLQAAVPVCGGINLEYYFSYVDNAGFGCGTKLPHNVSSLLGVMDGAASDLRTGLPWQMVEIHDPVRLLFIIETTPAAMLKIMDKNEGIGKPCRNGWVQVATLSPDSDEIHVLRGNVFERYRPETSELPRANSSPDWYRGWREHLGYALIEPEAR